MSGEEVVLRKTNKQPVLLKDKRRLREKRRSTGIGELDLDNLMLNDELTASNTALNESPLLPFYQRRDRISLEAFTYPSDTSIDLSMTSPSLENTLTHETPHKPELKSCRSNSELVHSSSSPAITWTKSATIDCEHCSVVLDSYSVLQRDCRQMKKRYEDELENVKIVLEDKDDQIEVLASKVTLLSDALKLADESYTRMKEENEILMKHFGSNL